MINLRLSDIVLLGAMVTGAVIITRKLKTKGE